MVLKYYYDLMSQPCRALYIFFKVNKIPFEPCKVALRKGDQFTEDFGKLNPARKVPVVDHNGFKLTESIAIFRYLTRELKTPDHWYPTNSQDQARVDEFLEWQHLNIRAYGGLLFLTKVLKPILTQEPPKQKDLEFYSGELNKSLDVMEQLFLKKTPYLNCNEISIADLIGSCEIEQPIAAGYNVLENRPILQAWMERVKSRVEPHYTEAHTYIQITKQKVASSKL